MDTFERLTEFEDLIKVYQIKTMNTISAVDIANSSISITDMIDTCLIMKANITQCKRVFGRPHTFYYDTNKCIKLVPIFKDQTSLSERALKAREHHSIHALIVRSYTMSGSLSLTIGSFLVLKFGNEFTYNY